MPVSENRIFTGFHDRLIPDTILGYGFFDIYFYIRKNYFTNRHDESAPYSSSQV